MEAIGNIAVFVLATRWRFTPRFSPSTLPYFPAIAPHRNVWYLAICLAYGNMHMESMNTSIPSFVILIFETDPWSAGRIQGRIPEMGGDSKIGSCVLKGDNLERV